MLKLQKISSDRQLHVIFRNKEYFFTYPFLIAFALAAGFHLLFFLIFHIAPIKLRWSDTIFPPVQVEADAAFQNLSVLMDADAPPLIVTGLPPTKPSLPMFPDQPTISAVQQMEHGKENIGTNNPFIAIEQNVYHPSFNPLPKSPLPPVNLVVSGPLATLPIATNGLAGVEIGGAVQRGLRGQDRRLIYNVLVDGNSGHICWIDPIEVSSISAVDHFAEEILNHMVFEIDPKAFVVNGEIEVHFNARKP